ncbi:MAG: lysozyme inhibitor LprI family protein [Burkholderiales bacterium]
MKLIPFCVLALSLFVPLTALGAIDCSRARSNAEKMICSNSRIAVADELMARAFRDAIHRGSDPRAMMDRQRQWIKEVRDVCGDVECMLKAYELRIAELDNF